MLRERLAGSIKRGAKLGVLDARSGSAGEWLSERLLKLVAIRCEELDFFAGHLRTESGESIRPFSRRIAFDIAFSAATEMIESSSLLSHVNASWRRDTVKLFVARTLWEAAHHRLLRVLSAKALSAKALSATGADEAIVLMHWPDELPRSCRGSIAQGTQLRIVGPAKSDWRSGRAGALFWLVREIFRSLASAFARHEIEHKAADPAMLLLMEDDISFDRSFRSQPHWLESSDAAPLFRTFILQTSVPTTVDASVAELEHARVEILPESALSAMRRHSGETGASLHKHTIRLSALAMSARNAALRRAAAQAARLTSTAESLAGLCRLKNVKGFLTAENYMRHADAMQLVAEPLGVSTLSFQYSCLPYPTLALATTAQRMVTFSPLFHSRFEWPPLPSPQFIDAGYTYDSSFALVRERARRTRAQMREAGAGFVIGLFDESVQRDKFGLVSVQDYDSHLRAILEWLAANSDAGVIVKTQFRGNIALVGQELKQMLADAEATGRLRMPAHGSHRNNVFPAEVAFASDITIGYAIGTTASVEAALAGCRSLIVNEYGLVSDTDAMFADKDIVYTRLSSALAAIDRFRAGDPDRRDLGSWESIISQFDPYRDGQASRRLHRMVESSVIGTEA